MLKKEEMIKKNQIIHVRTEKEILKVLYWVCSQYPGSLPGMPGKEKRMQMFLHYQDKYSLSEIVNGN